MKNKILCLLLLMSLGLTACNVGKLGAGRGEIDVAEPVESALDCPEGTLIFESDPSAKAPGSPALYTDFDSFYEAVDSEKLPDCIYYIDAGDPSKTKAFGDHLLRVMCQDLWTGYERIECEMDINKDYPVRLDLALKEDHVRSTMTFDEGTDDGFQVSTLEIYKPYWVSIYDSAQ